MLEKVLYSELTPMEFSSRIKAAPIAYLPLGTLEWHGTHLPLGSDGLQASGFFHHLAGCVGGIVLPMLFIGPDLRIHKNKMDYHGMDILGFSEERPNQLTGSAYWVPEELFDNLLQSILTQLVRAGFKIIVAHGHGPSTKYFQKNIKIWEEKYGLRLFTCWREDETDGYGVQTDHAGANETSLMMYLHSELVQMENLDQDKCVFPTGVMGKDPRIHAGLECGRKIVEEQGDRMKEILKRALEGSVAKLLKR